MTRRVPHNADELNAHLAWLRYAVHDRKIDVRLVLEGVVDALEAVADLLPGPRAPE